MLFVFHKKYSLSRVGFTLIELLVVIAIIGLLASIVLASLNSARLKSRDTRRLADLKQIQVALEFYFDGVGNAQYPAASGTCDPAAANGYFGLKVLSANNYIPAVSRDPQATGTSGCYLYATPAAPINTYHIGATMEDSGNKALLGDKDCTSSGTANCVSGVTTYTNGFAGTDPVYDLIP